MKNNWKKVPKHPSNEIRTENVAELIAISKLKSEGFDVVKNGWPDFLAINLETKEIKFVEVKPGKKKLKPRQNKMARIFSILGLEYLVWNVDTKTQAIIESKATGEPSTVMSHHRKTR